MALPHSQKLAAGPDLQTTGRCSRLLLTTNCSTALASPSPFRLHDSRAQAFPLRTVLLAQARVVGSPAQRAVPKKIVWQIQKRRDCAAPSRLRLMATAAEGSGGQVIREVLSREGRTKLDPSSDRSFYAFPRLVKHVDDGFLAQLTALYREQVPAGGEVLDLMSSWVSHLPPEVAYKRVVGHGLNAQELAKNPRLEYFFVKDLNEEQKLEAADQSFDAVLITVSVQYLQQPEKVFAEIYRILRPGGVCIVSFSNRLFYEKAVAAWREGSGYSRVQLVKSYFSSVKGFTEPEAITQVDPLKRRALAQGQGPMAGFLEKVTKFFERSSNDPFYAVVAYRNFRPIQE